MAITRCPYCHAITDENDKYCNNCGTQLLFTEDEEIEEEIPGEKIIDAEVEEKDYTVDEPEGVKRPAPVKDLDREIDEELEEEIPEETEEMDLEEVILVDGIEASEAKGPEDSRSLDKEETADLKEEEPGTPEEEDQEDGDKEEDEKQEEGEDGDEDEEEDGLTGEIDLEEEIEEEPVPACRIGAEDDTREYTVVPAPEPPPDSPAEPAVEYLSKEGAPEEAVTAGQAGLRPATFDTQELEDLGKTVDLSGERVDKFIEVMADKAAVTPAAPLEPPVEAPPPAKPPEPSTGSLPPWASTMRGAPVFPEDTGPVETRKLRGDEPAAPDTDEEIEIFPRRRAPDSTIGLPEQVSQAPLPFGTPGTGTEEAEEESEETAEGEGEELPDRPAAGSTPEPAILTGGEVRPVREPILPVREAQAAAPAHRGIEPAAEIEEPAPRPPFSFSVFVKSKTFDILFVGLFWLVALWLAASSMGLTLFDILGAVSGAMLMLYAVLVFLYFFLFKFFLGETLGDRLFRPR